MLSFIKKKMFIGSLSVGTLVSFRGSFSKTYTVRILKKPIMSS